MSMEIEPEEPLTVPRVAQISTQSLWHRLAVRFVLLLGFVVFLTTVSIDSFQHQASAADMPSSPVQVNLMSVDSTPIPSSVPQVGTRDRTYRTFNSETAERLGHSDLTSASLTRNRLTSAHLFTRPLR